MSKVGYTILLPYQYCMSSCWSTLSQTFRVLSFILAFRVYLSNQTLKFWMFFVYNNVVCKKWEFHFFLSHYCSLYFFYDAGQDLGSMWTRGSCITHQFPCISITFSISEGMLSTHQYMGCLIEFFFLDKYSLSDSRHWLLFLPL